MDCHVRTPTRWIARTKLPETSPPSDTLLTGCVHGTHFGVWTRGVSIVPSGSLQMLAPLSKVNLVVGQNNAGKSDILRFIRMAFSTGPINLEGLDYPLGAGQQPPRFGFGVGAERSSRL